MLSYPVLLLVLFQV